MSPLTSSYLEAVTSAVAGLPKADRAAGEALLALVVEDILVPWKEETKDDGAADDAMEGVVAAAPPAPPPVPERPRQDPVSCMLDAFALKSNVLCFDEPWTRKLAGCIGISILTSHPNIPLSWIVDRQLEFFRPLLFVLRDMPSNPPATVSFVEETILATLRRCNEDPSAGEHIRPKLVQVLMRELASTNSFVRQTARTCLGELSRLVKRPLPELLAHAPSQLLAPIFDKPLRALPFNMQIGNIEAITFCLQLRPSPVAINDELIRCLTETIALADATDVSLIGNSAEHRSEVSMRDLRVACLQLLRTAMAATECFITQKDRDKEVADREKKAKDEKEKKDKEEREKREQEAKLKGQQDGDEASATPAEGEAEEKSEPSKASEDKAAAAEGDKPAEVKPAEDVEMELDPEAAKEREKALDRDKTYELVRGRSVEQSLPLSFLWSPSWLTRHLAASSRSTSSTSTRRRPRS